MKKEKKMKLSSFTTIVIVFFAVLAYAGLVEARPETYLIPRVEVHDFDYVAEKVVSTMQAPILFIPRTMYILTHSRVW